MSTSSRESMAHREWEKEQFLRHQHSASSDQSGRALIPMWDSSDPDRAPPPLPLNPQSPSLTSRAGTSAAIQSAHAALSERARESAPLGPSLAKRVNDSSPERALVKGGSHRRLQSMVPGSVRDLSLILEGATQSANASPTRSPDRLMRSGSPTPRSKDDLFTTRTESHEPGSPGSGPGPSLTPILKPTALRRPPPQCILGENTPPQSSTMLALQTMGSQPSSSAREADPPLADITNTSNPSTKYAANLEGLSAQILSLTSIAKVLQKEMSQLSRRSRDNATDLLSLKEATNTRDEDIRRNLRDLMGHVTDPTQRGSKGDLYTGLYLDNKPHNNSSPNLGRPFQLPRIPSPKSFSDSLDRASVSTPSLVGTDTAGPSAASVILMEKIIKDMGTKEGQDLLLGRLGQIVEKLGGMATAAKVEELARDIRSQSQNAMVLANVRPSSSGVVERDRPVPGPMTARVEALLGTGDRRLSAPSTRGADLLNDDLIKIIRSVKDSVAQGGGLTAEVKALVRELRGEVLGMGRELGRRLGEVTVARDNVDDADGPKRDEVSRVIDQGLEQMKESLSHVLREHRRQSAQSASSQKSLVDYQEIYNAMRAALRDNEATQNSDVPDLSRDDVIEAVRDAWEAYKPEISVEQVGLERDEILVCLKEGLKEYAPQEEQPAGATRDEVFAAVVEGLKHFVPPQVDTPASLSRDEIIEAVRDCLEEFEFPVAASAIGTDMTRADMVHAVKEGLNDLEIPRGGAAIHTGDNGDIVDRLHEIMELMQTEFKAVSDEAKENVAANGRDTEQVLDATKDGLENLRVAIESYVDRATGAAGQEDFMHGLLKTMEAFKEDIAQLVSNGTESSREQLATELEGIRDVVHSSMVPSTAASSIGSNNQEVLEALHSGLNSLRQEILRPRAETSEILDALNDGLNDLRAGIDRIANKPTDLTANDEILDALKAGLDSVRSDIDGLRDTGGERALAAVATRQAEDHDRAVVPADMLKQDDIKNLEVLITQLRIKVEAMEPDVHTEQGNVHREDLERLEDMLRNVQQGVDEISSREPTVASRADPEDGEETVRSGEAASRDDVQAIETILRNTKARLDDLVDGDQAVRKEHVDAVETLVLDARETLDHVSESMGGMSRKEDLSALEELMNRVNINFEELKERAESQENDTEKISKTDLEAVETVVLEIKNSLDGFTGADFASISNKEDISNLETLVKEAKSKLDTYFDSSEKALTMRKEEMDGVGERVNEVRSFLTDFREAIQTKLEDGATGVDSVAKLLETMGDKMDKNDNVGADLKEMFDTMKSEFEESKDIFTGAKLETDEKLQQATESIGLRIDDKIGELIGKYEEFQAAVDEKNRAGEERDAETESAVMGTKAVAEELKLLIDTLGSAVTDSLEKMEEASKTVYEKVEELSSRAEETHTDHRTEHELTRDRIQQTLSAVEGMQGEMTDYQPKILEAVKDVLLLVGEHFEHSKSSASDIQERIVEAKPAEQAMLPAASDKYDDSEVREKLNLIAEQKYDDSEVREKLALLAEQKYDDSELRELLNQLLEQKYDDSVVNEKLDQLVEHKATAEQAIAQFATLDKVHQSVSNAAAEISQFLSSQTQRISNEHEDREKAFIEATVELEKKLTEKEHTETAVLSLKQEEDRLRASIMNLRTEQESLIRQKTRLTGDVSSLETAMRLRKEELSDMEHRAESLERRIVEGVMDHSRVLLMAKNAGKGSDAMSRKRVKKPAEETSRTTPKPVVKMALSANRNFAAPSPGAARRIVSLSQMDSNVQSGGVKRSQSVRTPVGGSKAFRKRSWGGDLGKTFGDEDKENASVRETVEELEEPDTPSATEQALVPHGEYLEEEDTVIHSTMSDDDETEQAGSDAGTETGRRDSRETAVTSSTDLYRESEGGYETSEYGSEWTESVEGSSVVSGSDASAGGAGHMVVYGQ